MKKRALALVMVIILSMMFGACSGNNKDADTKEAENTDNGSTEVFTDKDPKEYSGTLKLLAHSEQLKPVIEKFEEAYPNVKVEMSLVAGEEQLTKINNMVQSGTDVPDLYTCRTQFVRGLVEADGYYADLSKAPFAGDELAKNLVPYTVDLGRDLNGDVRVLSWQAPIGGIFYRRSMAKEYFGTDDPEEISKLFSSYDKWLETARTVKEKSGGKVKAFSDFSDTYNAWRYAGTTGWVTDGKLTIDENVPGMFDFAKTIYTEDLDLKIKKYTPEFYAAIANQELFSLTGPTWVLNFNLMPSSPETAGDWALASAPNSYNQGGTFIGIYEKCKQKELAWQFIKFLFGNEEAITYYASTAGDYVSNMNISSKIAALPEEERAKMPTFAYMGNQNIYEFYNSEVEKGINSSIITNYDERFDAYIATAMESYCKGDISYEEAIQQFKDDVATNAPEVVQE